MYKDKAPPRFESLKRGSCVICLVKRVKRLTSLAVCRVVLIRGVLNDVISSLFQQRTCGNGQRFVEQDPRLE